LTIAALSLCIFSELGEVKKEFCNKKKKIRPVQQACKRITARALFASIHGMS